MNLNSFGVTKKELGSDLEVPSFIPHPLTLLGNMIITQISSSLHSTIFLTNEGKLIEINQKDPLNHDLPSIKQISSGSEHHVLLTKKGDVYAWGNDDTLNGSFGIDTQDIDFDSESSLLKRQQIGLVKKPTKDKFFGAKAGREVLMIVAGHNNTFLKCKESNDQISWYGCGSNEFGNLCLDETFERVTKWTKLTLLSSLVEIFKSNYSEHFFGASKEGKIYGWGKNTFAQLGYQSKTDFARRKPKEIKHLNLNQIKKIETGPDFTCVLDKKGQIHYSGISIFHVESRSFKVIKNFKEEKVLDFGIGNDYILILTQENGFYYITGKKPIQIEDSRLNKRIKSITVGYKFSCYIDFNYNDLLNDFLIIYQKQLFTDAALFGTRCHQIILEKRTKKSLIEIKKCLANYAPSKTEIDYFIKWVYGLQIDLRYFSMVFKKLKIKKKIILIPFDSCISDLYFDQQSKDFNLINIDQNGNSNSNNNVNSNNTKTIFLIHKLVLQARCKYFNRFLQTNPDAIEFVFSKIKVSNNAIKIFIFYLYFNEIQLPEIFKNKEIKIKINIIEELKKLANNFEIFSISNFRNEIKKLELSIL
ncbi:regulator of chromosome condensation [Anaeramoeba flamelloides]|uniref:Regulator of chromosome condensation n=1 Tax=Anaeramoeba flamelloides TaxID=1746091 RepID=A0ABQ8XFE9_9EUKA|nr:regulator of chromosome condensation [Anaeramoeba flamelloides]